MSSRSELLRVIEKIETVRLDESIYLIIGNNRGTFPYCNALLIVDDDAVLIDSGCGNEIMEQLADNVDILINSHYHIDHILGNALIGELWVVEEEAGVTSSFEKYRQYAGIYNEPVEEEWLAWFHDWFVFIPSKHTRTFHTNEAFDFGDTKWQVVHTPGHSPGGIVLIGNGVVFSGDTLFQFSIGRTDFPGGSYSQLMTGIFEHLMVLPDETIVYSGHGPQTTIGMEKKANPFVRDWARRMAEES